MLDLGFTNRAFATHHRRFMDDGLPAELSSSAFAAFDREAHDPLALARGRSAWQAAARNEYRSLVAFTEFLQEITLLGLPFDVLGTGARVVRDEARHVELCRRMVEALGGDSSIPGEPGWVRMDPRHPPLVRILQTVVGSLCIGESASVRMLALGRDVAEAPLAKRVLTQLVADESIHSRFGWELLELLRPSLDADLMAALEAWLPHWFLATEETMTAPDPVSVGQEAHLATGPATPFGSASEAERREVFRASFEKDVLARFEALDIPARRAFQKRKAT